VGRRWLLRQLATGTMGVTLAGALVACGAGSPAAESGTGATAAKPPPGGPQKVDVWWSIADNNPSVAPAWEDFKRRHAGWTGELTMGVTYEKFQTTLAGGVAPDAYFGSFETIQVAAYKKLFAPLDGYISRDKVNMDQYYFGSKAGAVFRGKVYGMPHHSNVRSVYVNQRVYREAGLNADKAPESWDDFRMDWWTYSGALLPGQRRAAAHCRWEPARIRHTRRSGGAEVDSRYGLVAGRQACAGRIPEAVS